MPAMQRYLCLFLIFVACQSAASHFTGHPGETWQGSRHASGIYSFRGLPYAEPPVGALRWQPPKPYKPRGGHQSASIFAPACMHAAPIERWYRDLIEKLESDPADFEGPQGSSEDCLYLNVWTPTMDTGAALPVMVWIHGGSNESGWAYEPDYRGNQLAQQNVVVISVAYRLGAFSMFALPELIEEQDGSAANYGLLDLIAALEFIQQHASAFGGDPGNVTLFGESAGAENIAALMASARAEPLFLKAIHQSGPALSGYHLSDVIEYSQHLAGKRNLEELRSMPAEDLYELQSGNSPAIGFGPVAGGHGLPDDNLYDEATAKPLLIGTNDHEWLMSLEPDVSLDETTHQFDFHLGPDSLRAMLPDLNDHQIADRVTTAEYMYCPSIKLADIISAEKPVFFYLFSRVRDGEFGQRVGAYHGAEIPYVFNHHDSYLVTNATDHELTRLMMDYWTNFARTGNPNSKASPYWPAYQASSRLVMTLNQQLSVGRARDLSLCVSP